MLKVGQEKLPESAHKKERFEVPKVKGHIQGNRTIINNFYQIAQVLGREPEHLLKFVLKELATPGELKKNALIIMISDYQPENKRDVIIPASPDPFGLIACRIVSSAFDGRSLAPRIIFSR